MNKKSMPGVRGAYGSAALHEGPDIMEFDKICNSKEQMDPLPHQIEAAAKVVQSKRGLLLFHEVGSGKTLTTLLTINVLINTYPTVYHLTSPILFDNFKIETEKFKMDHLIKHFEFINIYDLLKTVPSFEKSIIIIDESQLFFYNLLNSANETIKKLYKQMEKTKEIKIILLSGTPIYDNPFEISPQINLLAGKEVFPRQGTAFKNLYFNDINREIFRVGELRKYCAPYVDYYSGINTDILVPKQKPIKKIYVPMTKSELIRSAKDEITVDKFKVCLSEIKKHFDEQGNIFVYCEYPGIIPTFLTYLEEAGIHNIMSKKKSALSYIYITEDNFKEAMSLINTEKIKIIIGSVNISHGITLPDCRFGYFLSIPDHYGKTHQIIGRIRRLCVHKGLPEELRDIQFYILIASYGYFSKSFEERAIGEMSKYYKLSEGMIDILKST